MLEVTGLGGLIILVLDIWAIVSIISSSASTGRKVLWTLLILIRPEIIIQTENEDILFPGLADEVGLGAAYAP